ncbi:type I addiction module toxin, SymE family [Pectobacterium brasiliense]|uniref:SymE family type I addiction module toxin n=1 Tax=Pectobacterium brasiliense TaxID=180957 RepID=UPI00202D80CB|nr:SymE family type I addiction module toxin [Pectobacterium brasiliense]MCL6378450.1 type I addiction module toxin, SymE family [Pectobacterium brasiliense]
MPPRRFAKAWGFWFLPHAIPSYSKKLHPPSATNLKGRWLEESGFMAEIAIIVMVERGKIVIETKINLRRRI